MEMDGYGTGCNTTSRLVRKMETTQVALGHVRNSMINMEFPSFPRATLCHFLFSIGREVELHVTLGVFFNYSPHTQLRAKGGRGRGIPCPNCNNGTPLKSSFL